MNHNPKPRQLVTSVYRIPSRIPSSFRHVCRVTLGKPAHAFPTANWERDIFASGSGREGARGFDAIETVGGKRVGERAGDGRSDRGNYSKTAVCPNLRNQVGRFLYVVIAREHTVPRKTGVGAA